MIIAVITGVSGSLDNYACSNLLVNPDASKSTAGATLVVDPPQQAFDPEMMVSAILAPNPTSLDLTKKQLVLCNTPVFSLGEILILDSEYGRSIPDGRKPSKWFVSYECFENLEDAVKRSKEVYNAQA